MKMDVRTIMLVFSALTLMFACLLALAGRYAGEIKGVWHWALAHLLIGVGFAVAYFSHDAAELHIWSAIMASVLVAAGITLELAGIQLFKAQRVSWTFGLIVVFAILISGIWFSVLHNDAGARAIVNSIFLALLFGACARQLFVTVEKPLRVAFWLTGLSFSLMTLLLLVRAIMIYQMPPESYGLLKNIPLNPITFFIASMLQMAATFGFILMIDYRLVTELRKMASHDHLTGAFNRRRLEEEAERVQARSLRTGDVMAVMMVDVDHFKQVNDRYGHQVGDEVLRRLAKTVTSIIRVDDYFARYGGEEFCILLPSTTAAEAMQLAERLRAAYAALTFDFVSKPFKSTISIGIADSVQISPDFAQLLLAADKALYQAKGTGRNRVMVYAVAA
ncbi:MAG: GGDEF domain-containing protein [Gammaproteobacteria bacterium]|nr:GGDEF domain-containing protein [Gammaproteobacteria bacterium]